MDLPDVQCPKCGAKSISNDGGYPDFECGSQTMANAPLQQSWACTKLTAATEQIATLEARAEEESNEYEATLKQIYKDAKDADREWEADLRAATETIATLRLKVAEYQSEWARSITTCEQAIAQRDTAQRECVALREAMFTCSGSCHTSLAITYALARPQPGTPSDEPRCDHPWHGNPALLHPCPECGAGTEPVSAGVAATRRWFPNEADFQAFVDGIMARVKPGTEPREGKWFGPGGDKEKLDAILKEANAIYGEAGDGVA